MSRPRPHRRFFRWLLIVGVSLLGAWTSGCPYVAPPLQLKAGYGLSAGDLRAEEVSGEEPENQVFKIHPVLMPLDFFPSLFLRSWDIGLGYLAEIHNPFGNPTLSRHGPSLSGYWYPLVSVTGEEGDETRWGMGVFADAEVIFDRGEDDLAVGGGGTLGISFEATGYTSDTYSKGGMGGSAAGIYHGHLGGGVFASIGYRAVRDIHYTVFIFGLQLRTPFLAGFIGK